MYFSAFEALVAQNRVYGGRLYGGTAEDKTRVLGVSVVGGIPRERTEAQMDSKITKGDWMGVPKEKWKEGILWSV